MYEKIKKVVSEVDVKTLSITDLYFYFLLCEIFGLVCERVEPITSEDYD